MPFDFSLPLLVALAVGAGLVVAVRLRNRKASPDCPKCGTAQPAIRSPDSLKQALWGGWTCRSCGQSMNARGFAHRP